MIMRTSVDVDGIPVWLCQPHCRCRSGIPRVGVAGSNPLAPMGGSTHTRVKLVIGAGAALSAALLAAGLTAFPPPHDGPSPARPWYLLWAGICAGGLTLTAALWAYARGTSPDRRTPGEATRAALLVAVSIAVLGVGEGAIYIAKHPHLGICAQQHGRRVCYQQPNRPAAERRATEVLAAGLAIIGISAVGVEALSRRRRRQTLG